MFTKRLALMGLLCMLLFASACGGSPATEVSGIESPEYYVAPTEAPLADAGQSPDSYLPLPSSSSVPTPSSNHQPYDMFFENYGVNPSIDTEDDNLSTFALDVDTGSYTVMRNYIYDGHLPPPESVRVEEYVNYFPQGYEGPPAHQAFAISLDGGPSPFTLTERYDMIRIGIQGYSVPEDQRQDASLTFVIDISGSMDMDNRLGLVKRSLELLVDELRPTDRVSIVVYGNEARLVMDSTQGSEKEKILQAIRGLHSEGATNAQAGLRLGYRTALRSYLPGGINRIILCSDGVANIGSTDAEVILSEVHGYVEEGITLATFGFGMDNYNDTLMEQLADNGDGFYAYIDTMDEARTLFVDELTSTLQTIAMNAKVQVEFNPEVVARYRLVGFENRAVADDDFRNNEVDAGEIGAGHSVTALYEIKLFAGAEGRIATVFLRWEDPQTRAVTELSRAFETPDLAFEFEDSDPYFQQAVVVAEYAEILKESYWADPASFSEVYYQARRVLSLMPRSETLDEFVDLFRRALELSQ